MQHNGRKLLCCVWFMLTVTYESFMLSVFMLNVVMPSVVVLLLNAKTCSQIVNVCELDRASKCSISCISMTERASQKITFCEC